MTKQSTGLCVMAVNLSICLLKSIKRKDKHFVYVLIGNISSLGAGVLWLVFTGVGKDFWNCCFGSLHSFALTNRIGIWEFLQQGGIFAFMELGFVCVVIFMTLYAIYRQPTERSLSVLLSFAISAGAVVYPIMDFAHLQVALVPFLLIGAKLSMRNCKNVSRKESITALLMMVIFAMGMPFLVLRGEEMQWSQMDHFYGIRVSTAYEDAVREVVSYVGEEESYIVDASAAMYHIPMGIYYKDYDMFLNGNLGTASALELVGQLKEKSGLILILKEECALNWQTPVEAVQYIREHYTKVGEVRSFEVYRYGG